jgi:hypothetical protein
MLKVYNRSSVCWYNADDLTHYFLELFGQRRFFARHQGKHAVTLTTQRRKIIATGTSIRIHDDEINPAAEGWNT